MRMIRVQILMIGIAMLNEPDAAAQVKQQPGPSVELMREILAAFNRHDLNRIMEFFADDCVLLMPRGPEPWGQRFEGKPDVRKALASRFDGIPDVHYADDHHWISGSRGVSQWTLTGTTRAGVQVRVQGLDLFEFRGEKIVKKDSYWKIVER